MLRCCNREWRDWANLPPELTEQIAGRLLRHDVTEYLRLRAACKTWRECTGAPRSLDCRFRPRRWIMLSNCDGARRRFLNLASGACAHIDLPELSAHHVEGATEGLLVLRDRDSDAIRFLNPFTRSLVELPSLAAALTSVNPRWGEDRTRPFFLSPIVDAAISDETSPPTVSLFLDASVYNIAYAKPGDERWALVDKNGWRVVPDSGVGRVLSARDAEVIKCVWFVSAMTLRGRIYLATYEGNVLELRLHPRPRLVPLVEDQTSDRRWPNVVSYLVPADDEGRGMLMVRYHQTIRHLAPDEQRRAKRRKNTNVMKLPTGTPGRYDWSQLEVFEVDLPGKRLVPAESISRRAVFVGDVACMSLSTRTFPTICGDAVYLGPNSRCSHPACGVRHLEDGRIQPALQLVLEGGGRAPYYQDLREWVVPRARPCSLEEYLVCYVGIKDGIKD